MRRALASTLWLLLLAAGCADDAVTDERVPNSAPDTSGSWIDTQTPDSTFVVSADITDLGPDVENPRIDEIEGVHSWQTRTVPVLATSPERSRPHWNGGRTSGT